MNDVQHEITTLPDIQNQDSPITLRIDQVGVRDIRYPLTLPLKDGGTFNTVACLSMAVSLPKDQRGTHMSRFIRILNEKRSCFRPDQVTDILDTMCVELQTTEAYLSMHFPLFLKKEAPVTKEAGLLDYECTFSKLVRVGNANDQIVGIKAKATSLCPCSKEISKFGAHNQRSEIEIMVRPTNDETIWFEELIELAESSASCPVYPVLKREDEKYVTERAYSNPVFVEDIVRAIADNLYRKMSAGRIAWFRSASTNFESIHNHNAYAKIESGLRGPLLGIFQKEH